MKAWRLGDLEANVQYVIIFGVSGSFGAGFSLILVNTLPILVNTLPEQGDKIRWVIPCLPALEVYLLKSEVY